MSHCAAACGTFLAECNFAATCGKIPAGLVSRGERLACSAFAFIAFSWTNHAALRAPRLCWSSAFQAASDDISQSGPAKARTPTVACWKSAFRRLLTNPRLRLSARFQRTAAQRKRADSGALKDSVKSTFITPGLGYSRWRAIDSANVPLGEAFHSREFVHHALHGRAWG